ncbi:hypothetical protein D9M69_633150 [compost metagenome]
MVDDLNRPVADAEVALVSSSYPYGRERFREIQRTDAQGKAYWKAKAEWRVEFLLLHGRELFFWNWCVQKEGSLTYRTQWGDDSKFTRDPVIKLQPGRSLSCEAY